VVSAPEVTPLRAPGGGLPEGEDAVLPPAAPPVIQDYKPGDIIAGRYEVERVFSGGMGNVYIARQPRQELRFAIKQPNAVVLSHPGFFTRVVREAGAWTRLGMHPHVAYCYFVRQIDNVPCIFVEYVDGGTLRDWIHEGRCAGFQVGLRLAVEFCHGMEHAHGKGMIHRDIKPENILMTRKGSAKVTDFGLVGAPGIQGGPDPGDAGGNRTLAGTVMGTPPYMSPEQWADPRQKSPEAPQGVWFDSEVFSFGVCLYEMFCGVRPYTSTRALKDPPPDPARHRPEMDKELAALLARAVHGRREERPQSFAELREALNAAHRRLFGNDAPAYSLKLMDTQADEINNQGYSYFELGQKDKAVAGFRQALARDPSHPQATYNLGLLEYLDGAVDDEEVVKRLKNASGNAQNRGVIEELVASFHAQRGNPEAARQAVRGIPGKFEALFGGEPPRRTGRLRSLAGHTLAVRSVAVSSDGRTGLAGGHGDCVIHWDLVGGAALAILTVHAQGVNMLAMSGNGKTGLTASPDGTARLYDLETGKPTHTLKGHSMGVTCAALDEEGRVALTGGVDKTLRLWDTARGECLHVFKVHEAPVRALAMTPCGRLAVSGAADGSIAYLSLPGRDMVAMLKKEKETWNCASLSADGRQALLGGKGGSLVFLDLPGRREIFTKHAHPGEVLSLALVRQGGYAVSSGTDGAVRLWDLSVPRVIRTLREPGGPVNATALSADGGLALFGGPRSQAALYELAFEPSHKAELALSRFQRYDHKLIGQTLAKNTLDQSRLLFTRGHPLPAWNLLLSAWRNASFLDDKDILQLYSDMAAQGMLKRLHTVAHTMEFTGHTGPVRHVVLTADGRFALSAGEDKTIRRFSLESGRCLHTLRGHKGPVHSLALSPSGLHLLSGGADGTVKYWAVTSGQCLLTLTGHRAEVFSVAFAGAGRYALSGSENYVKTWDLQTGQCMRTLQGNMVRAIATSGDGKHAVWASGASVFGYYDLASGECLGALEGHEALQTCVAVSRDGLFALSGDKNGTVKYWLLKTGRALSTLPPHQGPVWGIGFSACGRFAFSAGGDGAVKTWELPTARTSHTFQGHKQAALSAAMSANGRYLISSGEDGALILRRLVWELEFPGAKTPKRRRQE
jgi:WD40 repeat protein/serine/threonine protein kinase